MKTETVWISCILAALFCGGSANASVIITLDQVGPNVEAMASGTVDLTDLDFVNVSDVVPGILPVFGRLALGQPNIDGNITVDYYSSVGIRGPHGFGSGGNGTSPSTSTGSQLWLGAPLPPFGAVIGVPVGYVSGMPLDTTATWDDTTLAALGVTPDATFTWTWGTGTHFDFLTLEVAAIPEPAPAVLLTLGAVGLALLKWRSSIRNRKP